VQVGALAEAKDALREVVQLPLQHPALFAAGSLARPTRGVLLFGPPGAAAAQLKPPIATCPCQIYLQWESMNLLVLH
jgi:ATP-dependent 26S proteasome regulatory subunit